MTITRHNYEEFFLLYLDNELTAAQRQMVEEFVRQNPDLEKEWLALQQAKLRPDKALVFPAKEALLQIATADQFIHFNNYTECFILYADEELTGAEKNAVEQFVYNHPQFQQEFELIQEAKMIPDNSIAFPDKETLYRHENEERPVLFAWWKPAAAAAVLIVAGLLWLNQSPSVEPIVRVVKLPTVQPQPKDIRTAKALSGKKEVTPDPDFSNQQAVTARVAPKTHKEKPLLDEARVKQSRTAADEIPANQGTSQEIAAQRNKTNPATSQIDHPVSPDTTTATVPVNPSSAIPDQLALKDHEPIVDEVEPPANDESDFRHALMNDSEEKSDNVVLTNISVNNKPGLRRFFRKASRYIDKTTALRSGDKSRDKSGILIGNIKIAFQ